MYEKKLEKGVKLMKSKLIIAAVVNIIKLTFMIGIAQATLSSTFWIPMTPDIQSYGVVHICVDNYFSVGNKISDESAINNSFATDAGLTVGVLPFEKLQIEIGVDYLTEFKKQYFQRCRDMLL
jgi:hypothetical protein